MNKEKDILIPLDKDLQTPKYKLEEFQNLSKRVLEYLPNIVSKKTHTRDYYILCSNVAGTTKYARPINKNLFIDEIHNFDSAYNKFIDTLKNINHKRTIENHEYINIDKVVYTIQQSIGVGMDFLCNPNSARKHVGNRFEEFIRVIISYINVTNAKIVFKIPYPSDEGEKLYSCETDIILSQNNRVLSNPKNIDKNEIVISLKTTSKDRLGKIFLDKLLMEKFSGHPVKVVGIFLNDVQRKDTDKISYTFVSGLFMVYTKFLVELEGVYFIDPPPITKNNPYNNYIASFSKFIINDIWKLLTS